MHQNSVTVSVIIVNHLYIALILFSACAHLYLANSNI